MDAVVFSRVSAVEKKVVDLQQTVDELKAELAKVNKIVPVVFTSESVLPGGSLRIDQLIETGVSKVNVKSIYVEGGANSTIDIELLSSGGTTPFLVYKNPVASPLLYDVVDLIYVDDDSTDMYHLTIRNGGTSATAFKVRIMAISSK